MIADVVSYAIAGIGFIYAAGRLFVRKGFIPSMNTVMTLAYHKVPHFWRFVSPASYKSSFSANEG